MFGSDDEDAIAQVSNDVGILAVLEDFCIVVDFSQRSDRFLVGRLAEDQLGAALIFGKVKELVYAVDRSEPLPQLVCWPEPTVLDLYLVLLEKVHLLCAFRVIEGGRGQPEREASFWQGQLPVQQLEVDLVDDEASSGSDCSTDVLVVVEELHFQSG